MASSLIVDGHEDIAYSAIAEGRDFRYSAYEKRRREGDAPRDGLASTGLPDALAGNVRVIFATLFVAPQSSAPRFPKSSYETAEEAEKWAREQLAYYRRLSAEAPVSIVKSKADLEAVLKATEPQLGLVLLMEGADPILRPDDVQGWFNSGVRIVGPAWRATRYAGGTGSPGPLTAAGRDLMQELGRSGFILDTSHLADASFFEALDKFEGTVIASHSNVRRLVPSDRQLSDDMINALVGRGGVVGMVFYNKFLRSDWERMGSEKRSVSLTDVVEHIKYICELAGDTRHVAIGTDLDGGFGAESAPREIDTVADLSRLGDALSDQDFADEEIHAILSENWLDVLRAGLPAR